MRKTIILILFVVFFCFSLFCLTACGHENKPTDSSIQAGITNSENSQNQGQEPNSSNQGLKHEHNFGEWQLDETNHWHECMASGICDADIKDFGKHSFNENDVCTVCKFQQNVKLKYYEIIENGELTAYSVVGVEDKDVAFLNIPTEHNGKPVTSIEKNAFMSHYNLTSVTIPYHITFIDNGAFSNCRKLVEVYNFSPLNITKGSDEYGMLGYYAMDVYTSKAYVSKLSIVSDNYVFYENGEEAYLMGYVGKGTDLVLPDKPNNKNYAIYERAFYCNNKITSVTLPNSVTSVGKHAFSNCYNLNNVTFGNGITSIVWGAFYGCDKLTSITIPNSVVSIDSFAFCSCGNLASVTIGENVTTIGGSAFSGCGKLTKITIPNSVTSIGDSAFSSCNNLTSITIPNSVTSIGGSAFRGCHNLTKITIPNSITSIGDYAFLDCNRLVEVYNLSSLNIVKGSKDNGYAGYYALDIYNSVDATSKFLTTKEGYIFYENGEEVYLTGYKGTELDLMLPDKYNDKNYAIHNFAFENNKNITSVMIPNGVTSIGDFAFSGCSKLSSITISEAVTSIGESAFSFCKRLTSVTIGKNVTSIGESAFYGCGNLTSITIPKAVTSIGESAFENCYKLVEVYNLSSLEITESGYYDNGYVGYYALVVYSSLNEPSKIATNNDGYIFYENGEKVYLMGYVGKETELALPDKYNDKNYAIYNFAFYNDINISSVKIGDGVTSIGKCAFESCESLTSVSIPNSVTKIGESAFRFCKGLTKVSVPDSVTSIGADAFGWCKGLTSVTIGKNVTSIGKSAFSWCESLTSITIPDSVTKIGENTFSWCESLTSVTIGKGVKYIDDYAFEACTSLTSVSIPDSVTDIEPKAFSGCSNLTTVTIGKGVESIGGNAFAGCDKLSSVTFADTENWCVYQMTLGSTKYISVTVIDTSRNALLFKDTFVDYYWRKTE